MWMLPPVAFFAPPVLFVLRFHRFLVSELSHFYLFPPLSNHRGLSKIYHSCSSISYHPVDGIQLFWNYHSPMIQLPQLNVLCMRDCYEMH